MKVFSPFTTTEHFQDQSPLCSRSKNNCDVCGGFNSGSPLMHSCKKEGLKNIILQKWGERIALRELGESKYSFAEEQEERCMSIRTALSYGNLHIHTAACEQE